MKRTILICIAAAAFIPAAAFAQPPAAAPAPPAPPAPNVGAIAPIAPRDHDRDHDRDRDRPKEPITFLGVETSNVPRVVSEQLGLPKGFGLVVDYVAPDGPAAAAGVQQNDIMRMLNDQILVDPDQLSKLIRSYPEGTSVTLTLLRKGAETKVTAKLAKKEVPARHAHSHGDDPFDVGANQDFKFNYDFGDMGEQMEKMKDQLGNQKELIRDAVEKARQEVQRAREDMNRRRDQLHVTSHNDGTFKSTRIDLGKAQIVYSDAQGEMRIEATDGKKMLTAKDPNGRLLFSGPAETKEDTDKMPPEVRQRFEKLQQNELSAVPPPIPPAPPAPPAPPSPPAPVTRNNDHDSDDDDDDGDEVTAVSLDQVSAPAAHFHSWWSKGVLI